MPIAGAHDLTVQAGAKVLTCHSPQIARLETSKLKGWWQANFAIIMYTDYSNEIFKKRVSTLQKTQCVTNQMFKTTDSTLQKTQCVTII